MPEIITPDVPVESSPTFEVPRNAADNAHWRMTGELPEKPKADSAPASPASREGKTAPASETGNQHQERPRKSTLEARHQEILDDIREAGLTPKEIKELRAELRSFKEGRGKTQQQAEPPKPAATEHTDKPASELKPPVKPKQEDFKTWDEYEAAADQYVADLVEYKSEEKHRKWLAEQAEQASSRTVHEKMQEAKGRYGDEAIGVIRETAKTFTGDKDIAPVVMGMLNDSPVWTDLLYTLGSNAEELQAFVQLSKTNPGAAIRKLVVMEGLVQEELAKGGSGKGAPAPSGEGQGQQQPKRGEDGKFQKPPERRESKAPNPPHDVSGRGAAPPDEEGEAVRNNNFKALQRIENERDLRRLRR